MPALLVIFEQFLAEPACVVPHDRIDTRFERRIPSKYRGPDAEYVTLSTNSDMKDFRCGRTRRRKSLQNV
jgi:hypothetical protein